MATFTQLECFRQKFQHHYKDEFLVTEINNGTLVAIASPYLDFNELVMQVCEDILDFVDLGQRLGLRLYRFGYNGYVSISINL